MKIAFCWSNISGYMVACLRELASRHGVDVLGVFPEIRSTTNTAFDKETYAGVNIHWTSPHDSTAHLAGTIGNFHPDVIVISGWNNAKYRAIARSTQFSQATKILAIDNQYSASWRQSLGRLACWRLFQSFAGIMVPGERSWQLARFLGFAESQIIRGTYGIDYDSFKRAHDSRRQSSWPRQFAFVGRLVEAKGIDILVSAYQEYRRRVSSPWTLTVCGKGPQQSLLKNQPGIEHRGFVQPRDLPDVLADHGAFVLPSRNEPWGQVIVEAAAAGLPIICTEACGAGVELVHNGFNGQKIPTGKDRALIEAMRWMHDHADQVPLFGNRSSELAAAYSAERWADRLLTWLNPQTEACAA
jgi:glycosyltransferase involved in cell wall biosynthesis